MAVEVLFVVGLATATFVGKLLDRTQGHRDDVHHID
jgi:hypothetical protein